MSRTPRLKLSLADRAHLIVLKQEARCERLERQIERRMSEHEEARDVMEGEAISVPHTLRNRSDQWECYELQCLNRDRPPSRICFTLPARCYDACRCGRYARRNGE